MALRLSMFVVCVQRGLAVTPALRARARRDTWRCSLGATHSFCEGVFPEASSVDKYGGMSKRKGREDVLLVRSTWVLLFE